MNFISFFVRNWQFTLIVFVLALVLGIRALMTMPRGEDPPFGAPIFIVLAVYPGTSPADMEELVANPLEEVLYNLGDIKKVISNSSDGLMIMQVEFLYGVNVDNKNNDVVREVNKVRPDLPDGLIILDVVRAASSDVCILQNALVSETASAKELTDLGEDLKRELERVRTLKFVKLQANPAQQIEIKLDLNRMAQYRLGLNQVLGSIQAANVNIPGGSLDLGKRRFNILTTSELARIEDIRKVIVQATPEGKVVHLSDIGEVRMSIEDDIHRARMNGHRAIWVISALKDRQNIVETRAEMEAAIERFKPTLPKHVTLETAFDQAQSVDRRLSGLGQDFIIAILLVMLTLVPLGWRASVVVMISIPLSLAIGVALLSALGYTLNQLSIVGMVVALGLLVDDSIVIVENIERFLRMGYSRRDAAIVATKQITLAVVGCTATLLLAFIPLTFLPEGAGEFIRSLPMAVLMTVLASLFVAMTIIPFLSSLLLKPHEGGQGNFFFRAFKKYINAPYQRVLLWAFRHPAITLIGTALIFLGSLALVPSMGFVLFPVSEKPMFTIEISAPPGTSLDETDRLTRRIEQVVMRRPEVVTTATNVGKGNPRVYYNVFQRDASPNFAELFVQVKPDMQSPEIAALCDTLRKQFLPFAGARIEVKRFAQGPPVPAPVEFRIIGQNIDTLSKYADIVEGIVNKTSGTMYVRNDLRLPRTDLKVVINKEKAGLLGILPAEVAKTVRLGLAGLNVSTFRNEEGDEFNINVGLNVPPDQAMQTFGRLYITSLSGALIPLNQIANLEFGASAPLIKHFNRERYTSVTAFNATGILATDLINSIEKDLESVKLPHGYRFVAAGDREAAEESLGGMGAIVAIALFGLFAILVLEFRTFKSTLIVLSVVPLGIIGAIGILYLIGEPMSFVATIGIIALAGIEIKNSILLVDYTNQLREQGTPLMEAIMDGAETRFLPILLTSLTAIGGLIPIVLESSPLISPLAWVIIGGLISSTILSRIITPLLYKLLPPAVQVKTPTKLD